MPAATAKLLAAWLKLTTLSAAQQPYVFVLSAASGHDNPIDSKRWTEVVKAAFKRHSGVPLAPKELRSSYVSFLRSEENDDASLKAAALAMRHSPAQQASPAYDKGGAARLSAAAVAQAQRSAARG